MRDPEGVSVAPVSHVLVTEAREAEKAYNWLVAAELYQKHLTSHREIGIEGTSSIKERIASCYARAARQATSLPEFSDLMQRELGMYEELASSDLVGLDDQPAVNFSRQYFRAKALRLRSWLAESPTTRRELAQKSAESASTALNMLSGQVPSDSPLLFSRTVDCYLHRLTSYEQLAVSETEGKAMQRLLTDAVSCGRRAVELISSAGDASFPFGGRDRRLCESYYLLGWFLSLAMATFPASAESENRSKLKEECWARFHELVTGMNDVETLTEGLLHHGFPERAGVHVESQQILPRVTETRDNLLLAGIHSQIAYGLTSIMWAEENPEKLAELVREAKPHLEEATKRFSCLVPVGIHWEHLGFCHWSLAMQYLRLARASPDPAKKGELLEKCLDVGVPAQNMIRGSSTRMSRYLSGISNGPALRNKAELESDRGKRRELLVRALAYATEAVSLQEEIEPYRMWEYGVMLANLGYIQFGLGSLVEESEPAKRVAHVREAIERHARGTQLLALAGQQLFKTAASVAVQATYLEENDRMTAVLYQLTKERAVLLRRLELLRRIRETYSSAGLVSYVAQACWQQASIQSTLARREEAARSYEEASSYFLSAAEKMPQIREYFKDFADYMKAWVEIERAQEAHDSEDFNSSRAHYERAEAIVANTLRWKEAGHLYHGLAQLEDAEGSSRADFAGGRSSIKGFELAKESLSSSSENLMRRLAQVSNPAERQEIEDRLETIASRVDYCDARVHLERAREYYRTGERGHSLRDYTKAMEILETLKQKQPTTEEKNEIEAIILSCQAWVAAQRAELESSPEGYKNAADLFLRAREVSKRDKASIVAKGNSDYCLALCAATKFMASFETEAYSEAKIRLADAAREYSEANLQRAAVWFRATERMLDAFAYVNNALREPHPEAKAKNYFAAEKVLLSAAQLYLDAGYPAKRNEVLASLQKVKEEKELALSLVDVFEAPVVVSSIASPFSAPTYTRDKPIGLSELQGANVLVQVSTPGQVNEEGELKVRLDLANTGKQTATLFRIEGLVPEGFKLTGVLDDLASAADFRAGEVKFEGKRLRPFAIESLNYTVRLLELEGADQAKAAKGRTVTIAPTVTFSDERGVLLTSSPTALSLTIQPLEETRWAAIMFTDVVGYSALAHENEQLAIALLEQEYKPLIRTILRKFNGKEIKTIGDAFLVEFGDALEATKCAIEIQRMLKLRNIANKEEEQRLQIRIGIHAGEVIHRGNDLFGDTVNIAARIEPLSDPGEICVTQKVFNEVIGKLNDAEITDAGSRELKNISEPIGVYRIRLGGASGSSSDGATHADSA